MHSAEVDADVMETGESQDERWSASYRREIRRQQREILNDVHKNRDDITIPDELIRRVDSLDTIYQNIVASKEAAIDSEGIRLLSSIGREQVETTHGELIQFDTAIYAEKLVTFMGGRRGDPTHLNWEKLGDRAMRAFRKPPTVSFLLGALDLEPLKKKQRTHTPRSKSKQAKATKPKEVVNLEEEEESTTKDVARVLEALKKECERRGRVHYFKFLVDPNSFAHTVENMFHFSFLVKDGRAGVTLGRDGQPYVFIPSDLNEYGQSTKTTKQQVITSFTMSDWTRAKEKFNITRSIIIPPTPHQHPTSQKLMK